MASKITIALVSARTLSAVRSTPISARRSLYRSVAPLRATPDVSLFTAIFHFQPWHGTHHFCMQISFADMSYLSIYVFPHAG